MDEIMGKSSLSDRKEGGSLLSSIDRKIEEKISIYV